MKKEHQERRQRLIATLHSNTYEQGGRWLRDGLNRWSFYGVATDLYHCEHPEDYLWVLLPKGDMYALLDEDGTVWTTAPPENVLLWFGLDPHGEEGEAIGVGHLAHWSFAEFATLLEEGKEDHR